MDFLSFFLGALSGAVIVGVFWLRSCASRDWTDADRFGPY